MCQQIPAKPLWAALFGVAAAASVSLGLASAISVGVDDAAPYPNAKAAPPPPPLLYEAAQEEPQPTFETSAEPATANSAPGGPYIIWAWGLAALPAPEAAPLVAEPQPVTGPDISPIVTDPVPDTAPAPAVDEPPAEAPAQQAPGFYLPSAIRGDTTMEARLLEGINAERAAAGLTPYISDGTLVTIARTRSQQMVDQGYFGHTDPNGQYMYTALLGYYGIGYAWAGENLAMNNYGAGESPDRALISLMNSSTHRANILASDFTHIGVGVVFHNDGRWFYTMIFTS